MDQHPPTHRILSDADVDAVARRVIEIIGKQLSEPKAPEPPPSPPPAPLKALTPKLAYTLQELSEEWESLGFRSIDWKPEEFSSRYRISVAKSIVAKR